MREQDWDRDRGVCSFLQPSNQVLHISEQLLPRLAQTALQRTHQVCDAVLKSCRCKYENRKPHGEHFARHVPGLHADDEGSTHLRGMWVNMLVCMQTHQRSKQLSYHTYIHIYIYIYMYAYMYVSWMRNII